MSIGWGESEGDPAVTEVNAGNFWPTIETVKFLNDYRIPSELPEATIINHLCNAIIHARRELKTWELEQGVATLADVDQELVNNVPELIFLWERAVFCLAKAEILRETQTVNRRVDADNLAKSAEDTEDKYLEFASDAMAGIIGLNSVHVSLI